MKIKTIGLLLSSSLILAACSDGEETSLEQDKSEQETVTHESTEDDSSSGESSKETSTSNKRSIALEDISLTASEALSIAEGEFEGDVYDISFEQEHVEWVYQIEMENDSEEAEVIINHDSEEVIDVKTEQDNDQEDQDEIIDYDSLNDAHDAINKAIADLGGGEIREWSLSMDDGIFEYDVDLEYENQKYEYSINAETLDIIKSEQDDD